MAQDFPKKLGLVMRITGCATQKELAARLNRLNPDTGYEPKRAYKWAQGRAVPRDLSIFDDLARLVRLEGGGDRFRHCSYRDFHQAMAAQHGDRVPPFDMSDLEGAEPSRPTGPAMSPHEAPDYLTGCFLAFSQTWTATQSGELIVGACRIAKADDGSLMIDFVERLPGHDLRYGAKLSRLGYSLYALMPSPNGETVVSINLALAPPPAPLLGGVMSGASMFDTEMAPSTGRVLFVRLGEQSNSGFDDLVTRTGYLDGTDAAIAAKLRDCGTPEGLAKSVAPDMSAFLFAPAERGMIRAATTSVLMMATKMLTEPTQQTAQLKPPLSGKRPANLHLL